MERLVSEIPGDGHQAIYTFEDLTAYHVWFAARSKGNISTAKIIDMPNVSEDKAFFLPRGFNGVLTTNVEKINDGGLWMIYRDDDSLTMTDRVRTALGNKYSFAEPVVISSATGKAVLLGATR
jgi:hypothetical protein